MAENMIDKAMANQVANIEKNTGKTLAQWTKIIQSSGLEKHGELVSFLKEKHGFTHGNANAIVHFAKKSHAGAAENKDDLIEEQYKGKEELREWYDKLMKQIHKFGDDIEVSPKKAYVSLRRKKQQSRHSASVSFRVLCRPFLDLHMPVSLRPLTSTPHPSTLPVHRDGSHHLLIYP